MLTRVVLVLAGTLLVTAFASTNAYRCSSSFSGGTLLVQEECLVTAFTSTNAYTCKFGFEAVARLQVRLLPPLKLELQR